MLFIEHQMRRGTTGFPTVMCENCETHHHDREGCWLMARDAYLYFAVVLFSAGVAACISIWEVVVATSPLTIMSDCATVS